MLSKLNSDFRHLDLTENAIQIIDNNNNGAFESGDYILFYGMSSGVWKFNDNNNLFEYEKHLFADEVSYFLTINSQSDGKRIIEKDVFQSPTRVIDTYSSYYQHESELYNLIQSGRKWFGERFSYNS